MLWKDLSTSAQDDIADGQDHTASAQDDIKPISLFRQKTISSVVGFYGHEGPVRK